MDTTLAPRAQFDRSLLLVVPAAVFMLLLFVYPFIYGLVLSFEHGVAKPAPQLFAAASEILGVPPEDALMVGDNALTDGGAIESGVRAYLLPTQHEPGPRGLAAVLRLVGVTAP